MHALLWNYIAYFVGATAIILFGLRALSQRARGDREAFQRSVPGTARVLKVGGATPSRSFGTTIVDLLIEVQRSGVQPYTLSTMWSVNPGAMAHLQPGRTFAIRVDPLDAQRIYSAETWARSLGVRKTPIE